MCSLLEVCAVLEDLCVIKCCTERQVFALLLSSATNSCHLAQLSVMTEHTVAVYMRSWRPVWPYFFPHFGTAGVVCATCVHSLFVCLLLSFLVCISVQNACLPLRNGAVLVLLCHLCYFVKILLPWIFQHPTKCLSAIFSPEYSAMEHFGVIWQLAPDADKANSIQFAFLGIAWEYCITSLVL